MKCTICIIYATIQIIGGDRWEGKISLSLIYSESRNMIVSMID